MQQTAPASRSTRSSRSPRSSRDLVISLVVLLVPVFLFVGVYRLLGHENSPVVDTSATFDQARAAAFPAASPQRLPSGWRVLSSDFTAGQSAPVLRVGLRAPGGGGVQLVEGTGPAQALVSGELGANARGQADVAVAGRTWRRYMGDRGLRGLVLTETGRTTIVVGTTSEKDLVEFAGTLP